MRLHTESITGFEPEIPLAMTRNTPAVVGPLSMVIGLIFGAVLALLIATGMVDLSWWWLLAAVFGPLLLIPIPFALKAANKA